MEPYRSSWRLNVVSGCGVDVVATLVVDNQVREEEVTAVRGPVRQTGNGENKKKGGPGRAHRWDWRDAGWRGVGGVASTPGLQMRSQSALVEA